MFGRDATLYQHSPIAQLARAPALQAGGQRFESVILHQVNNLLGYELT